MPEEFAEISAPEERKKKDYHPGRMKRFVRHLSTATISAEERAAKKQAVKSHLERVKSLSLNKRTTKQQIEHEFGSFEDTVQEIIKDEEKILAEQRKETKQIGELKTMVENLSTKLIDIGREYARELEAKDSKIMELREALAAAHIKISESGEDRQKKIEDIERRIKQKQPAPKKPRTKADNIAELEARS
jgi:small-conductance mechanosensitive channel